jgi:hypothetical protein
MHSYKCMFELEMTLAKSTCATVISPNLSPIQTYTKNTQMEVQSILLLITLVINQCFHRLHYISPPPWITVTNKIDQVILFVFLKYRFKCDNMYKSCNFQGWWQKYGLFKTLFFYLSGYLWWG